MKYRSFLLFNLIFLIPVVTSAAGGESFPSSYFGSGPLAISEPQETDQFLQAKELIFEGEWNQARLQLERYLLRYPSGRYQDEALFWLARSLEKLSRDEVIPEKKIALRQEAVQRLDSLLVRFPASLWWDDARNLKITVVAELVALGASEYENELDRIIAENLVRVDKTRSRMAEMNVISGIEPEAGVALIKRILAASREPELRKSETANLAKFFPDKGRELLEEIAAHDQDEEVRNEAQFWLEQIRMWRIPTQLVYFGFSAQVSDLGRAKPIAEGKINVFTLPRARNLEKEKIKARIRKALPVSLEKMTFATATTIDLYRYGYDVSNVIQGFHFKVLREELKKEMNRISGQVRFMDRNGQKKYKLTFLVDSQHDQLLAVRKGGAVALVLLHFIPVKEIESIKPELPVKLVYHTVFQDVLGCKVLSTRRTFNMVELSQEKGVTDFGRAEVEIPGFNGYWKLKGELVANRKERKFIARNAQLLKPDGKVAAEGPRIVVPADAPHQYTVIRN